MRRLLPVFLLLSSSALADKLPRPDHVVVVIEENRSFNQIMDTAKSGSYIHQLAKRGMLMTQSYGITHPSQPNYLALFSGSTQGSISNYCPLNYSGSNLASSLMAKNLSFASYSESMAGAADCSAGPYQRKHNPVANWPELSSVNLRFKDFPADFTQLPTISFVIPDQQNNMHDGSFYAADEWLKTRIDPYLQWAYRHNSLLILTWDEDNGTENNRIVTLLAGPMVKQGVSSQRIDHYSLLRTLLDFYDLPAINDTLTAEPIRGIWKTR